MARTLTRYLARLGDQNLRNIEVKNTMQIKAIAAVILIGVVVIPANMQGFEMILDNGKLRRGNE